LSAAPSAAQRDFALAREVDAYVGEVCRGYTWRVSGEGKVIRDAVHGYQLLEPHEVAVLNSPLVQRTRLIHQTALAYFVYPTATHTRFDHGLGVAKVAGSMADALVVRNELAGRSDPILTRRRLRLAALLHDIGHVMWSHLGESLLSELFARELAEARAAHEAFADKKIGDILSYLMITSPTFVEGLNQVGESVGLGATAGPEIAGLVLGYSADPNLQFEADIVSGPFDADKLDYLLRDCHFSGIRSTIDIDRLYLSARVLREKDMPGLLAWDISSIPNLEQVLFAKLMLFPALYHHQKVRAFECTFRSAIELIRQNRDRVGDQLQLERIRDWLRVSEQDFLVWGSTAEVLRDGIGRLIWRQPLRRAVVLSRDAVSDHTRFRAYSLKMAEETPEGMRRLRQEIHDRLPDPSRCPIEDVWVDLPRMPDLVRDIEQTVITWGDGSQHATLSSDQFQWTNWTANYAEVKWRGHVFCRDEPSIRKDVGRVAAEILRERFGVELTAGAWTAAKNERD